MFRNCSSLTQAPDLPAQKLTDHCYCNMFYNCSSLKYIKCLATNISETRCTYQWVENVPATGTFVKAASMSGWQSKTGTDGIPSGWTVQNAN